MQDTLIDYLKTDPTIKRAAKKQNNHIEDIIRDLLSPIISDLITDCADAVEKIIQINTESIDITQSEVSL